MRSRAEIDRLTSRRMKGFRPHHGMPFFAEKLESEMLPVAMATILDPFQALQADKDRRQNLEERT